jgi:2-methylcitrate dehydratase PrpD
MTALETMGAFVAQGVRGHVPAATRAAAKLHVTDTVVAWIAGAHTAEGRALIAMSAPGAASVDVATGGDLAHDIGIHCALARLSEIDNIHLASATTPGGIVIPAALTIAAGRTDTSADALLEAIVAGTEAMVRLGSAIGGPTVLYRGIWPTYFAAPFGVAAVAARLYQLDTAQTAQALALALTFASPGVGHHNAASTSRWFAIGHATRNGHVAAQAAQAGFTSDLSLLDGSFLHDVYGITPSIAAFTENLGERYVLDDTSFKPWCAARQTIAATQALLEMIECGVLPETMTSVEVHVPPPYLKMINHEVKSGDRASHLTSVHYHLALAACDPSGLYDIGHSPQRIADDVQAFMQKVSVSADETLLAHYPKAWPARVVVHTAGRMQERLVIHAMGDPQRPFDDRRVEDKFHRVLAPVAAAYAESLLVRCRSVFDTNRSSAALVQDIARVNRKSAE